MRLRLAAAPAEIQKAAASGRLSQTDLDVILRKQTAEEQMKSFWEIVQWKALPSTAKKGTPIHIRYFKRPSQHEIVQIIVTMLDASVIGLTPRALAYCAGFLSKEEFAEDVKKAIEEQEAKLRLLQKEV